MSNVFSVQFKIEDRFLDDVLITAVEGGIGYWSLTTTYVWDVDPGNARAVIVDQVSDAYDEESQTGDTYTIDKDVILRGIEKIVGGYGHLSVSEQTVSDILRAVMSADAGEIDADAADAIVQAALFGRLVYG